VVSTACMTPCQAKTLAARRACWRARSGLHAYHGLGTAALGLTVIELSDEGRSPGVVEAQDGVREHQDTAPPDVDRPAERGTAMSLTVVPRGGCPAMR
jgi:hypothetical protein